MSLYPASVLDHWVTSFPLVIQVFCGEISQDYTMILSLIKPPPKHQRPLVPHSLTITVGAKWWFYVFLSTSLFRPHSSAGTLL